MTTDPMTGKTEPTDDDYQIADGISAQLLDKFDITDEDHREWEAVRIWLEYEIVCALARARARALSHPGTAWRTIAERDVIAERARQIFEEGWTPEHDDVHDNFELARAAATYAVAASYPDGLRHTVGHEYANLTVSEFRRLWPWEWRWWKPKDRRRDLVRSAALILAEIERLDRLNGVPTEHYPISPGTAWRTIDSAPRDGTQVLLWFPDFKEWTVGQWHNHWGQWTDQWNNDLFDAGDGRHVEPTHYMLLPQPPVPHSETKEG